MKLDLIIQRYDYNSGKSEAACYGKNGELAEFPAAYLGKALWCEDRPSLPVRHSTWKVLPIKAE